MKRKEVVNMLKRTLNGMLAIITALGLFSGAVFAQTEEELLFSDNFESGTLNSDVWKVTDTDNIGKVKNEQVKYLVTTADGTDTFKYPYSGTQEDVALTVTVNAETWSDATDAMLKLKIRKINDGNYYGIEYNVAEGKFELVQYMGGESNRTSYGTAEYKLDADKDYTLSLQARHGIVRFEVDGVAIIQDYTHKRHLYEGYTSHYAEFSTTNQSLKVKSVSVNEEDTLFRQKFANKQSLTFTGSHYTNGVTNSVFGEVTPMDDCLKLYRNGANVGFGINAPHWEYISIGDDFSTTETNIVMKTELVSSETIHIRTANAISQGCMYITKIQPTKFSIGGNYNTTKADASGWRAMTAEQQNLLKDGNYHTYTVRTVSTSDYSSVKVAFLIDGVELGSWTDTSPRYTASSNLIPAGGISVTFTGDKSVAYVKSFEVNDVTASDKLIYSETFDNIDTYWTTTSETAQPEIVVEGNGDNMYYTTDATQNDALVLNDKKWKDITVAADIKLSTLSTSSDAYAGIMARYTDKNNYLMAAYSPSDNTVFFSKNGAHIAEKAVDAWEAESTHRLGLSVKDGDVRVTVDGTPVIMTQFDPDGTTIGSVALKSEEQAAKFDNVKVSGNPYYFYEDFTGTELPDWSGYKWGTAGSSIKARSGGADPAVSNGVLETTNAAVYVMPNKAYSASWDDVLYTARMKTAGSNLASVHLRVANADNACYCVCFNASNAKLFYNSTYNTDLLNGSAKAYSIESGKYFDLKLRVTDVTTAEGKAAVRLRLYIDNTEIFDYTDDGSAAQAQIDSGSYAEGVNNQLKTFPRTADKTARGFGLDTVATDAMTYDYITISDPNAGTMNAALSADKTSVAVGDTVTATLNIENNKYDEAEAMFITAVYDKDGELKDVKATYPTVDTGASNSFTQEVTVDTTAAADWTVRVFAWNGWNTMNPLTSSLTIPVVAE